MRSVCQGQSQFVVRTFGMICYTLIRSSSALAIDVAFSQMIAPRAQPIMMSLRISQMQL